MKSLRVQLILFPVLLCVGIGCNRQASTDNSDATHHDLTGRLGAAMAIASHNDRDSALVIVAKDAAKAGDRSTTIESIKGIQSHNLLDATAAEVAVVLAKAGKSTDATAVAQLIQSHNLRDQTLEKIAKNQ